MEKKKDKKFASATSQEPDINNSLSKEEENQPNVTPAANNTKTSSPSHENAPPLNQQYPQIVQWPYTAQPAVDQSSLISRPCAPTQSPSPIVVSQWQLQDQGQPPSHVGQSTTPFWLHQRPGYHLHGVQAPATFQPFTPLGAIDAGWQAPAVVGGGTLLRNQPQVPNFCYHVGYPYSGFPGPWDPSSWWTQGQQSQPSCSYTFPGAYGYSSPTPPMSGCSASLGQSFPRGTIRPTTKLSQKHQQLWEAQSAENVQLWTLVGQLQSELDDYKSRIIALEEKVSSPKLSVEQPAAQVIGTALSGKSSKRGRPKRSVASVDVSPSPDESHPRARGRKPAQWKVQPEARTLVYEKVILNKVDDNEKLGHSTATIQQEIDEKIPTIIRNINGNMENNGSNLVMPAFPSQVHHEIPRIQICGSGLNPSSEMKSNDDSKSAFSILSQKAKGINTKGSSATYTEATNNENLGWPSNISAEDSRKNLLNMSSQGFYGSGNVIRQGGKLIPGWCFVNEEDASEELEDAVVGSAKDENEEMGDDASSGAEEIARAKNVGAYNMDCAIETSPKGLPQFNSW